MWRGYHKFASDERFAELAATPSASPRPRSSPAGPVLVEDGTKYCCVWDGLVPPSLCEEILQVAELRGGYQPCLLNVGDDKQEVGELNESVRKGQRCVIESSAETDRLALRLWQVLEPLLPPHDVVPGKRYAAWRPVGVNPTLRVLKYDKDDFFDLHQDGSYSFATADGDKQRSFLTLQIYLNNGGGQDFE